MIQVILMRQHHRFPRQELHPDFRNAVYVDPRGVTGLVPLAAGNAYRRLSTVLNARRGPRRRRPSRACATSRRSSATRARCSVADLTTRLTLRRAAQYTKLSAATILRAVRRGELTAFRVGGRRLIRFRAHDLKVWIQPQVAAS